MPFEGSTEVKVRGKDGKLAAQWREQRRARPKQCRRFPQCRHTAGDGLSSDWSWRIRPWSQPLCGVEALCHLIRELWRSGWHLMPPYGGRVSGRAACPFRRGVASSEAEMICPSDGRLATLERGGDDPPPRGWACYPRARGRRGARPRASAGSPRARRRSPHGFEGLGPRIGLL